jgi:N-carbamoylputrescine amidase
MKISLIQMNGGGTVAENVDSACRFIDKASEENTDIIILPEFFNTVYFPQYRNYKYVDWAERVDGYTITKIVEKARQHKVYIIASIYEEDAPGIYYSTAMLISPNGSIVGKYRKTHPAAIRSLEKIYFRFGSKYPIFSVKGWRLGIILCYDIFFPEAARALCLGGAELIVIPFATPKNDPHIWFPMLMTRAYENGTYVAACNKVGKEGDLIFTGESAIVSPSGTIMKQGDKEREEVISVSLDRSNIYEARKRAPMLRDRRPDLYGILVKASEDAVMEIDNAIERYS